MRTVMAGEVGAVRLGKVQAVQVGKLIAVGWKKYEL